MKGFGRTLFIGAALLCILLVTAGITAALVIKMRGGTRAVFKQLALTDNEQRQLAELSQRGQEPPVLPHVETGESYQRTLEQLAQKINESTVREMVEKLSQREAALDEREEFIKQKEIELRLAQGDLLRLQRQLEAKRQELRQAMAELERRQAAWAADQAKEAQQLQYVAEVERTRVEDLAQTYAAMKKPWQQLRRLPPEDIALFLSLMEARRAAKILDIALEDRETPGITTRIHRAMLTLDLEGISGDQVARLARLYNYMKPEQVVPYLAGSDAEEIARILMRMETRKRAAVKEALDAVDPERSRRVDDELERLARGGAEGDAL